MQHHPGLIFLLNVISLKTDTYLLMLISKDYTFYFPQVQNNGPEHEYLCVMFSGSLTSVMSLYSRPLGVSLV